MRHHRAKGFCRAGSAVFTTEPTAKTSRVVARRRLAVVATFGASRRRAKRVEHHHRTHLQRFPERRREKVSTSSSSSSKSKLLRIAIKRAKVCLRFYSFLCSNPKYSINCDKYFLCLAQSVTQTIRCEVPTTLKDACNQQKKYLNLHP